MTTQNMRVVWALAAVIAAGIGCQSGSSDKAATETSVPAAAAPTPSPTPAPAAPAADSSLVIVPGQEEPLRKGADFPGTLAFVRDTRTFKIAPLDGVEFNYRMEKGGMMVYSWKASDSVVWDFHGEPKGSEPGYAESYAMGEGKDGNGGFLAPTSGIHGWFWENQSDKPVTVTLTTAGHYTEGLLTMPDDTRAPKPFNPR
jgi:hypothetical protein